MPETKNLPDASDVQESMAMKLHTMVCCGLLASGNARCGPIAAANDLVRSAGGIFSE